jgi:hypothetical protein
MVKHINFHPEICKLLDELDGLRELSRLRANDLLRDDISRAVSSATATTYSYCMNRIMDLRIKEVG